MKGKKEVVTVFLRHQGRILLLRRSDRVGTYRGRWAGVSGYLETEPIEQAYIELREETSLERSDISRLVRGEPLEVFDEEEGMAWRVHPFLADVIDPDKIRLDWESEEMRWVDPSEIARLETVPGLDTAFRLVCLKRPSSSSS